MDSGAARGIAAECECELGQGWRLAYDPSKTLPILPSERLPPGDQPDDIKSVAEDFSSRLVSISPEESGVHLGLHHIDAIR